MLAELDHDIRIDPERDWDIAADVEAPARSRTIANAAYEDLGSSQCSKTVDNVLTISSGLVPAVKL